MTAPLLELSGVSRDYRGLRPLRVAQLTLREGEHIAILGPDRVAAEVFVNLITGATLPDKGDVRLFGRSTHTIADSADWLSVVDRFGIVGERAVLLDGLSVVQNLALPFTLEIEPPPVEIRERAVALAREVGLADAALDRAVGELDPTGRLRVRFGRALAHDPAIVVFEHPTAGIARGDIGSLGSDIRTVATTRGTALLVLTGDREFAGLVAARVAALDAATGQLDEGRGWFSRFKRA